MKIILTNTFFILLLILTACEDVIDIDLAEGKKTVVVEGWLTNKPETQFVKLYYTNGISANADFNMISNARVTLSDNASHSEILTEVSPGKYQIGTLKSAEGKVYTLKIESSAGNYEAIAPVKRNAITTDSLRFKFEKKSVIYEKEGYYPLIYGQELSGEGDFMQFRVYRNGTYMNKKNDFNITDDKFVDGNYIGGAELAVSDPFLKDDMVKVEIWSLTEDAQLFWTDIQRQLQNGQMFASPLANTRTNVRKTSSNSTDVIGYFGASLVQTIEKKVE